MIKLFAFAYLLYGFYFVLPFASLPAALLCWTKQMGVGRSFSGGRRALISELLDEKIAYSTGLLPCRLEAHRKRMEVVVLPPFFATMLPECAAHSRNRLHRLRAAGFRSCLPGMENKRGMEPQEMKLKCAHERKRIILCIVRWIFVVRFRCSSFVNFHFKPSKIAIAHPSIVGEDRRV